MKVVQVAQWAMAPQETTLFSAPIATVLAAVISLITAVTVAYATYRLTGKKEERSVSKDLHLKRLNEFYAPIKLLLDQDKVLIEHLREGKPEGWHLLDNVATVISDDTDNQIASQIIAINKKIALILEKSAGLSLRQIPQSYSLFLGHYYMLERAFTGKPFARNNRFEYFPRQFEEDINSDYAALYKLISKEK
ncbi:hypothetical protein ACGF0J_28125 [Nonomuraea sp. NPDC047897]|uniref:hypothetical protein n=1 Tax=Nonomuraea sp. NPDC047897 TaxID=3364346 RepID=UPI00371DAF62